MEKLNNQCIVVLGTHYGGTSVLMRCLHLLGINVGENLATIDSPTGEMNFYNQDISLVHDIALRDLGYSFDMAGAFPKNWEESKEAGQAVERLERIVERQFLEKGGCWAIADPRMCRLMPIWFKVFQSKKIEPKFIFMVRHPTEVALHLKRKYKTPLLDGHLLWLIYNKEAFQHCSDYPYVLMTYDQLLADPVSTIANRFSALGVPLSIDPSERGRELIALAQSEKDQSYAEPEDESFHGGAFTHYAWIYEQFRGQQLQAIQATAETRDNGAPATALCTTEVFGFPLSSFEKPSMRSRVEQSHIISFFNNLLEIVARHELIARDYVLQRERLMLASASAEEILCIEVFLPQGESRGKNAAHKANKILIAPEEWQQIKIDISQPDLLQTNHLEISPLNTRGVSSLSDFTIVTQTTGEQVWSASTHEDYEHIGIEGDAILLSTADCLEIVCTGNNARVFLPKLKTLPDVPLCFQFWVRASRKQTLLHGHWMTLKSAFDDQAEHLEAAKELLGEERAKTAVLEHRVEECVTRIQCLENDLVQGGSEQENLHNSLNDALQIVESLKQRLGSAEQNLQSGLSQIESKEKEVLQVQEMLFAKERKEESLKEKLETLEGEKVEVQVQLQNQIEKLEEINSRMLNLRNELHDKNLELEKQYGAGKSMQNKIQKYKYVIKNMAKNIHESNERFKAMSLEFAKQGEIIVDTKNKAQKSMEMLEGKNKILQNREQEIKAKNKNLIRKEALLQKLTAKVKEQTDELECLQHLEAQLQVLTIELDDKKLALLELRKQHQDQKNLSGQYREALIAAEREAEDLVQKTKQEEILRQKCTQELDFVKDQKNQIEAKLQRHINLQTTNDNERQLLQQNLADMQQELLDQQKQNAEMVEWLRQLDGDFAALMKSKRWAVGNTALRAIETILFRSKKSLASDHMKEIFDLYREDK